jgi:DNA-binding GntR family transcriptional regulator
MPSDPIFPEKAPDAPAARQQPAPPHAASRSLQKAPVLHAPVKVQTEPQPPPPRQTHATRIGGWLRDEILTMHLLPRMPLVEKELTERFGVSRTPVREALIRLAEEGLVLIYPQSGTFVAPIPLASVREAVVVRQALELAALDLVTARLAQAGPDLLDSLDAIVARQKLMAQTGDRDGFHVADEAFHRAIAGLAGYPGLWSVAQSAKMQVDRCRRLTLPVPGRMAQVIGEHEDILARLRAGDEAGARAAMVAHLTIVLPDLTELQARHPDYFV